MNTKMMGKNTPVDRKIVDDLLAETEIDDLEGRTFARSYSWYHGSNNERAYGLCAWRWACRGCRPPMWVLPRR